MAECRAAVIVEYWLAGYVGRVWLQLHKGLRSKFGDLPALCGLVAHGNSLAAGELWRARIPPRTERPAWPQTPARQAAVQVRLSCRARRGCHAGCGG